MIFGTCNHEISLEWFESGKGEIAIKDHDKQDNRTISYVVVCESCLFWYGKNNLILRNDNDKAKWLKDSWLNL